MTKRLARLILLTVWATLIAGSVVAYLTTRSVLVSELDGRLLDKASSLPQIVGPEGTPPALSPDPSDRFIIANGNGQTLARPRATPTSDASKPVLVRAAFLSLSDGQRMRTITAKALARATTAGAEPQPVTIIYTGSAERLDRVLSRLTIALVAFDLIGGLAAWMLSLRLSRAALRPLTGAAETIGTIDEGQLDRRIDTQHLPDELIPVASRLNELLERLERAFSQRRQFLADASHELRTPIAALVTMIEVALRRPREADEYKTTFETCLSEANMLRRLVQRLMEQARSEQFAHDEPAVDIDVTELLDECASAADVLAAASNVRIVRSYRRDLRLRAQPNRLRSIVTNLLSNAVEYNRPGEKIEIVCDVLNTKGLDLTIRDSGKGIGPEHLPHVFEPFYRVDASRKRDPNHLGLGLFLVRSHVRAMNGDCSVESTPGVGTSFRILIPDAPETPENRHDSGISEAEVQHA